MASMQSSTSSPASPQKTCCPRRGQWFVPLGSRLRRAVSSSPDLCLTNDSDRMPSLSDRLETSFHSPDSCCCSGGGRTAIRYRSLKGTTRRLRQRLSPSRPLISARRATQSIYFATSTWPDFSTCEPFRQSSRPACESSKLVNSSQEGAGVIRRGTRSTHAATYLQQRGRHESSDSSCGSESPQAARPCCSN